MLSVVVWVTWSAWVVGVRARALDPAACAARFDVQRDKIIRTEESREMGAQYLSELDVGARAECLRLCCETDGCDVFVFEEKSPGSCYLFKCGPPEDFRCKFTSHGNFSSGVLEISRHLAELQDEERLVPLHHQLAELSRTHSTTTSTPRPPPMPLHPAPPALPATKPPIADSGGVERGRCSRYQFACRAGGECIAVYNACDGVPQCADGSDEAPELGCPVPSTASPPPHPRTYPPVIPQVKMQAEMEENNNRIGEMNVRAAEAAAADLWPHRLTQAQPQHRYNSGIPSIDASGAGGPHIFSHKGGLVQELDEGLPPPPAPATWPHRTWQPSRRHPGTGLNVDVAAERENVNMGMDGPEGEWMGQQLGRAVPYWPSHHLSPETQQQISQQTLYGKNVGNVATGIGNGGDTMPELAVVYTSDRAAPLSDAPKKGFELAALPPEPPTPPHPTHTPRAPVQNAHDLVSPPFESTTKKKALKDKEEIHVVQKPQSAVVHEEYQMKPAAREQHEQWASDEHEGLSEHPAGALLLLVLGTLMTAALGTVAGCRARATRRRRHKRYALDADYLVNGMYL
ncbi:unnamed protein product [Leptosia nina]|uniref:MANSC domain-containing protein n=1 Tax=Leptosia nina TaxID=320188 RepID=A0AAV1JIS8_9NEOP